MSDADTLLEVVLENPEDDSARLILADCLRESSDDDARARGRFLWAGVIASHYRHVGNIDDPEYYTAIQEMHAVAAQGAPAGPNSDATAVGELDVDRGGGVPGLWIAESDG